MGNWQVLPHGPLEQLSPRVHRVEGDLEGMPLKRVMTVGRTASGKLVVHNAMALDDAGMKALDALGPVGWVLVPNAYHRIDAPRFAERYPDAKVLCPPAAREKVAKVVRVDGTYADFPEDAHVRLELLDGTREGEGVMIVTDEDGATLVFNDAIFNMPHVSGFTGFVFRYVTRSSGGPTVSRIARLFLVKEKAAFRSHLARLAETAGLRRVIVSHHETIEVEPARVLREVAASV